jgi:DNA polymerase III subunit epsilon
MRDAFFALDVETANPWYGSICQIGLVRCVGKEVVDEWNFLIDPECYFDYFNVQIHGITEEMVKGSPTINQVWPEVMAIIGDSVVAHYGPFDRAAINQAIQPPPDLAWLDAMRVVRRHWRDLSQRGFGLKPVCERLGFDFQHHDAVEDAKATAFIFNRVIEESGNGIEWWTTRAYQRATPKQHQPINFEGDPKGVLAGETVLFTGTLSLSKRELGEIAARHGCNVASGFSKKITMLVVGEQDPSVLKGHDKSTKC